MQRDAGGASSQADRGRGCRRGGHTAIEEGNEVFVAEPPFPAPADATTFEEPGVGPSANRRLADPEEARRFGRVKQGLIIALCTTLLRG